MNTVKQVYLLIRYLLQNYVQSYRNSEKSLQVALIVSPLPSTTDASKLGKEGVPPEP